MFRNQEKITQILLPQKIPGYEETYQGQDDYLLNREWDPLFYEYWVDLRMKRISVKEARARHEDKLNQLLLSLFRMGNGTEPVPPHLPPTEPPVVGGMGPDNDPHLHEEDEPDPAEPSLHPDVADTWRPSEWYNTPERLRTAPVTKIRLWQKSYMLMDRLKGGEAVKIRLQKGEDTIPMVLVAVDDLAKMTEEGGKLLNRGQKVVLSLAKLAHQPAPVVVKSKDAGSRPTKTELKAKVCLFQTDRNRKIA